MLTFLRSLPRPVLVVFLIINLALGIGAAGYAIATVQWWPVLLTLICAIATVRMIGILRSPRSSN